MVVDTTNPQSGDPSTGNNPDLMTEIQKNLMNTSGMISSANTGAEQAIQNAMVTTQQGGIKGDTGINAKYDLMSNQQQTANDQMINTARERGGGINGADAAYIALSNNADKQMKDLELQRTQALAANDQATYAKVADLQVQTAKMKTDAMKQTFDSLIQMGNLGIQQKQEAQQEKTQNWNEQLQNNQIALQYGVKAGKTLAETVSNAIPNANAEQRAKLASTMADINYKNAEAAKLVSEQKDTAHLVQSLNSPGGLDIAVKAFQSDATGLYKTNLAKNPEAYSKVSAAASQDEAKQAVTALQSYRMNGMSKAEAIAQFNIDFPLNNRTDNSIMAKVISSYNEPKAELSSTESSYSKDVKQMQENIGNFEMNTVGKAIKYFSK